MDDDYTVELLQRLARRDQNPLMPSGGAPGRTNQSPGAPHGGINQSAPRLPEQELFMLKDLAKWLARMRSAKPGNDDGGGHASGGGQTSIGGEFD